jgi:predicted SAM-dependent methyltransferase
MTTAPVEAGPAISPTGAIRLNLGGAGEGYRSGLIPGFLTVDLREGPETDIIGDVSDLSRWPDNSVDELYSSNVLEHFSLNRTVDVLKEWCRVLKPGASLWLSVPDFNATVRIYLQEGLVDWVQYLIWGDQKHALNYHYINFTFPILANMAVKAGFSDIRRLNDLPYGIQDASVLADSIHRIPISLNVEIRK